VTFVPGMQRVPGSGRAKGTENRATALARARVRSAMETFRDAPNLVKEVTRFLQDIAAARTAGMTVEQIAALPREELMLLQSLLSEAAKIALKSMEFAYPKLHRIDYVGDAPNVAVQQKMTFKLRIGQGQPPQPVTTIHAGAEELTNGSAPDRGNGSDPTAG